MIATNIRPLAATLLFAVFLPFALAATSAKITEVSETTKSWDGSVLRIEDSRSRVSLASVLLSVSDLTPEDGYLVGEYSIEVPLMQSKNDRGQIILPLDINMEALGRDGGTLRGQAISFKEDTKPNAIVCQILPDTEQSIHLDISTEDRTIHFRSRYTIVEPASGS